MSISVRDGFTKAFASWGPGVSIAFVLVGAFELHPGIGLIVAGVMIYFLWMCAEADRTVVATKQATDDYYKTCG